MREFNVEEGDVEDFILGRSLAYQLILVQTVFALGGSTDNLATLLNKHKLNSQEPKISQLDAERLYEAISQNYMPSLPTKDASVELSAAVKARALAEVLYARYKAVLIKAIDLDQEQFGTAYKEFINSSTT